MSIIKQNTIKNYMEGIINLLRDEGFMEEGEPLPESEYYNDSLNILREINFTCPSIELLFDYFFFNFSNSGMDEDSSKYIKNLIKSEKIEMYDLLLDIQKLGSHLMTRRFWEEVNLFGDRETASFGVLNFYKLFLMYCFDICYGSKRLFSPCYKDAIKGLDNICSIVAKKKSFKDALKLIYISSNNLRLEDSSKFVCNLKDSDLALFQRIRFKYDFILSDYLLKNLLDSEYVYYSNRFSLEDMVISALKTEVSDSEYNVELTGQFYSLLRKRAYLIPKGGISITSDKLNMVMDIYERQFLDENFLIIISNIGSVSYSTIINLTNSYMVNNSPCLYDICNFLFSFYKLDTHALEMYGDGFIEDPNLYISFRTDNIFTSGVVVIKGCDSVYNDFIVEVPYYWKYRGSSKPSKNKKEFLLDCSESGSFTYISAFKRRLPVGQVASEEARKLSRYYCLDLDENETLVSPFIRSR